MARDRGARVAAMVSLPVLPLAWFVALQEHPPWMPGAYLGYLLVVIVVPGTMFWRRLTGGTGWFTTDVVLGTAFGLAVEALLYPIGMVFRMPFAALVMPALAFGMYRALPRRKLAAPQTVDQRRRGAQVVGLSGQQAEVGQVAERVGQRQDLGGHAAPGAPDGLALSPPFAPCPWRWALTMLPSTIA